MRVSTLALVLALSWPATACEDENPGLLLHVVLPTGEAMRVGRVAVTLESAAGPLGTLPQPKVDHGVNVSTQNGRVQLEFLRESFPIAASFDVLLVPQPPRVVSLRLSGQAFLSGGELLARAGLTGDVELRADRRTSVTLAFACVAACRGVNVGTIDLATPPQSPKTAAVVGASDGDRLVPMAIGHFDDANHARGDLVVAAPARGLVYVLYGRAWNDPGFPLLPDRSLSPAGADRSITLPANQIVGAAAAGDIDGNGVDDLVVTAFNADAPTLPVSSPGAGVAYLFPDTRIRMGSIDLNQAADDAAISRIYGGSPQQQLGKGLALGHISSPGAVDILLGAPGAGGSAPAGRVYVFFARTPPHQLFTVDPGAAGGQDVTIVGARANLPIGRVLALADFADGDGRAEVAIGNPFDAGQRGTVTVVRGASLTAGAVIDLATTWDLVVTGPPSGLFGSALAFGDLDGSGTLELIAGAPGADTVYVLDPVLGPRLQRDVNLGQFEYALKGTLPLQSAGTGFGSALGVGDFDGDARADLLVGAPTVQGPIGARTGAGACFVVASSQLGPVTPGVARTRILADEPAVLTMHGAKAGDALGERVLAGNWDVVLATDKVMCGAQAAMTARGTVYAIHDLP